ncbi:MAG: hypothetical protein JSU06_11710 [Actinobacteria bacterium]|nr:hypothetical protein [Actinomycetota bacterium]
MDARAAQQTPESDLYVIAAWKLPLIIAALACSIVGGFYVGGPGLGLAVGALAVVAVLFFASSHPPRPPIVPRAVADARSRLLMVVQEPDAEAILTAAALAASECDGGLEILILVPLVKTFVERWSEEVGPPRRRAQARIVEAMAILRRAGAAAGGRIGDEDPVQAVADTVAGYPASRVALVGAGARSDRVAGELAARLTVPFMHLRGTGAGSPALAAKELAARLSQA